MDMGRLIAVYRISASEMQRAFFVLSLSILFSGATAFAYLLTHKFLFLLLAFGFTVVSMVSLISFVSMQRLAVAVYEGGLEFRKFSCLWNDIESVEWTSADRTRRLEIKDYRGRSAAVPASIGDVESLKEVIARYTSPRRQT